MARKSLKKVEKIKEGESMKLFPCVFGLNNSSGNSTKRSKPKIIYLLLFSLISSCFVFAPHLFYFPYPSALFLIGTILQSCTTSISLPSFCCCCCCPNTNWYVFSDTSIQEIEDRVSQKNTEPPKPSNNG